MVHYDHSTIWVVVFEAVTNIDLVPYITHPRKSVEARGRLNSSSRSRVQKLGFAVEACSLA
jgi:hypothetical protein